MQYREASLRAEHARQRIGGASGCRSRLKSALRSYVRNDAVKYEAAYRVLGVSAEYSRIQDAVANLNLFEPDTSPILFWRLPKRKGGYRTLYSLSPIGRMRQTILKDGIEKSFLPDASLFLIRKRGRDREALRIREALNSGYHLGVCADIRDAFPNASAERALCNTPLPPAVIRGNLSYEGREFVHDPRKEDNTNIRNISNITSLLPEGPRGLIQGAASSSIIFALLLNDMSRAFSSEARLFVYGDDILVLTRNDGERAAARASLERYIHSHPSGSFQIEVRDVDARRGFSRVGYGYQRSVSTSEIEIVPDDRKRAAIEDRLRLLVELNVRRGWRPDRGAEIALRHIRKLGSAINFVDLRDDLRTWMQAEAEAYAADLKSGLQRRLTG